MNDDLLDLLKRIRKAVHDALPDKTDPLELDAAIDVALRENTELGKRYDQLAATVDRRIGELEAENERLRGIHVRDEANRYLDRLGDFATIKNLRAENESLVSVINELCPALVGETHEQTLRRTMRELREERDKYASLYPRLERLREALEVMDTKLEVESSFEEKGETYVAFYRVPAGPWHKILAMIRGG